MQENELVISICVPQYKKNDDTVYYQVVFSEDSQRLVFAADYRYSQLKKLYESLQTLKGGLPRFPSSYWWRSTNTNEELIEERRIELDYFFKNLLVCPEAYKSLIMKNFILKSQCLHLKRVEKEQHEMMKKERVAGATPQVMKQKSKSQLTTPVCKPADDPEEDPRDRSRSWEFKLIEKKSQPKRVLNQLNNLSFGGTPIFRGILTKFR